MKKLAGKLYSESYKAESRELKWAKKELPELWKKVIFYTIKKRNKKK